MSHPTQVGIIGAGISGLAAAYRLHEAGCAVQVFEANDHAGGVIRTTRRNGFLVEEGPNSINGAGPALAGVMRDLGLDNARVESNPKARNRFVVRNARPVPIPQSLSDFVRTPLLSARAKARLFTEPFRTRGPANESLARFVARRLGPEVLDYAVNPFVAGVYGGRPDKLAVQHAFPALKSMEKEHGSLFIGGIRSALRGANASEEPTVNGLFSFEDGLDTLPRTLAAHLHEQMHLGCPVHALVPTDAGWRIEHAAGSTTVDAVVYAAPLHTLGTEVTFGTSLPLYPLHDVPYAPMRSVSLGFKRDAVSHPLDGFGMLLPAAESSFEILGTIFASTLFPKRAPDGHVLLTTFVGGARAPEHAHANPDAARALVMRDLQRLLGVTDDPVFSHQVVWPHAIPQYTSRHGAVKGRLDALEAAHSGLQFAGNYRTGISVEDAFDSGWHAADTLLA